MPCQLRRKNGRACRSCRSRLPAGVEGSSAWFVFDGPGKNVDNRMEGQTPSANFPKRFFIQASSIPLFGSTTKISRVFQRRVPGSFSIITRHFRPVIPEMYKSLDTRFFSHRSRKRERILTREVSGILQRPFRAALCDPIVCQGPDRCRGKKLRRFPRATKNCFLTKFLDIPKEVQPNSQFVSPP